MSDCEVKDNMRFGGNRIKALTRDNFTCCKCGMKNDEHIKRWKRSLTVDHYDGNRKNNQLSNLFTLCLICHGYKDGRRLRNRVLRGEKHPFSKLKEKQVLRIRLEYKKGNISQGELARRYKVDQTNIKFIVHGKSWKHLE